MAKVNERREYFAAAALGGILANPTSYNVPEKSDSKLFPKVTAIIALEMADALIAELDKNPQ